MLKILKNKKGDSTILQVIICITILTFMLFFPIISFSYFKFQMSVDDIAITALETAIVRGGVDEEVMEIIVSEFQEKGYSFEGETLNGSNGAKVIVWTNTNLCKNGYTFTTAEGNSCTIEIRPWPEGDASSTTNPDAYYNSTYRRYRTGYSSFKDASGNIQTINNGSEIKIRITVPISAHVSTINALYGLINKGNSNNSIFLNEGYGYSVTLSGLSEIYQESQIVE